MALGWQGGVMIVVLFCMFVALMSDKIGADMVMCAALAVTMATGIVNITEGCEGFANEGLLTVVALFVVAAGISRTGGLDWYMGKLLGTPRTVASAQLRVMVPIAIVSGFLNNTPVVAVMIPIVQRWADNNNMHPGQLMIPLSFASILGGTCTLIGTSTNLVVEGMLQDRYGSKYTVGLFDLGAYGVPVALSGLAYILVFSPWLLPGGPSSGGAGEGVGGGSSGDLLVGARVMPWSKAIGCSVGESGLRGLPGLFLVSVQRAGRDGAVIRAVGPDVVLSEGDVLWFTGLVESLVTVCDAHGLQAVEAVSDPTTPPAASNKATAAANTSRGGGGGAGEEDSSAATARKVLNRSRGKTGSEDEESDTVGDIELGAFPRRALPLSTNAPPLPSSTTTTSEASAVSNQLSTQQAEHNALQVLHKLRDLLRDSKGAPQPQDDAPPPPPGEDWSLEGFGEDEEVPGDQEETKQPPPRRPLPRPPRPVAAALVEHTTGDLQPPRIVVTLDDREPDRCLLLGMDVDDRPGLLYDISQGLSRLRLQVERAESCVIENRSVSIWRCELQPPSAKRTSAVPASITPTLLLQVQSVMAALVERTTGVQAVKRRGLAVLRATIIAGSDLIGKTIAEANFRQSYRAAIVAVQRNHRPVDMGKIAGLVMRQGDILVLQVEADSPLLLPPPPMLPRKLSKSGSRPSFGSFQSLLLTGTLNTTGSSNNSSTSISSMGSEVPPNKAVPAVAAPSPQATPPRGPTPSGSPRASPRGTPPRSSPEPLDGTPVEAAANAGSQQDGAALTIDLSAHSTVKTVSEVWADLSVHSRFNHLGVVEDGGFHVAPDREFLAAMRVKKGPLVGQSVQASGLRGVPGLFLVSHERTEDPEKLARTLDPEEALQEEDVLWFAGSASAIGDLRKVPGLEPFETEQIDKVQAPLHERRLVQVVVARTGPLCGKKIRELRFRTRFGAAVVAVHREGARVHARVGDVALLAGDVLLLEAGPAFLVENPSPDIKNSFALIAPIRDSAPPRLRLLIPSLACAVAMLAVYTAGLCPLLVAALFAAGVMMASGCLSQEEARQAVKWDVYVTIASAFGISTALSNSGLAEMCASFLVKVGAASGLGDSGLFIAVYLATFLISNVVTNNAAAALLFPIAIDAAEQAGISVIRMSYLLMLAASASFMSPFGYQTNLMVFGPGGYKFRDFVVFGLPMQFAQLIISVLVVAVDVGGVAVWWFIVFVIFLIAVVWRTGSRRMNTLKLLLKRCGLDSCSTSLPTLSPSANSTGSPKFN